MNLSAKFSDRKTHIKPHAYFIRKIKLDKRVELCGYQCTKEKKFLNKLLWELSKCEFCHDSGLHMFTSYNPFETRIIQDKKANKVNPEGNHTATWILFKSTHVLFRKILALVTLLKFKSFGNHLQTASQEIYSYSWSVLNNCFYSKSFAVTQWVFQWWFFYGKFSENQNISSSCKRETAYKLYLSFS